MFICLFFILLSGCQKEQDINLLYNKWEFEYFKKQGLSLSFKESLPDDLNKMTVEFLEDGKVIVGGQCNGGSGTFEANRNGSLKTSDIIQTLIMCSGIDWEERFFNAIVNSKEYKITDKKLKIYYENDDETDMMVFKKQ